ncbi:MULTISPECIES: DeoR/GlpR family DNA-binding transcription regulator [Priestia]|uniref:DeoR/GlpR family DNA-binding transcription regulator n=1 Tax=Priestia TaxID=2800373 RepID=UPI00041D1346|nr:MULTISPECIES: DeoR/GlpR family DNA-binding transcription regulator [Priestia]MBK0006550.1 DeoR/GlpR transcriptional regulator [Bacillus sp. S35]MCM3254760.1 DeoR/GlpR family DNA-binding transcription regulator [Priestia aryabhattai]MCM3641114.1 DeoR/GlpR family DNA-binding transcription regulator [Priestia aryabhattai]PFW79413.1 DeoR family transcriptional regulator [Priestia aryabhattai]
MLTPERHQLILKLLKEKELVKVQEFIEVTGASESTIRRDLSQLEEEQMLKRVHGGASLIRSKRIELSVIEKSAKNVQDKRNIAEYAASIINEGDCIFLDAGTTTYEMIPFLKQKDVVVVTNGLMHLNPMLEQGITLYLIGGSVKHKTGALIGNGALLSLEQYRFDKCFMGANGIHHQYGYTTPDPEEALIKQTAMKLSRESYILSDSTKFFETSFAKVADLHEAKIITNDVPSDVLIQYANKTDIKVVKS